MNKNEYLNLKRKYLYLNALLKGGSSPFLLNDSLTFFQSRLAANPTDLIDLNNLIKEWVDSCRSAEDPVNNFVSIMDQIRDFSNEEANWKNLPEDPEVIKKLWGLRECIVCITFETIANIYLLHGGKTIQIDEGFELRKTTNQDIARANILGSTTLLSDIDVTIESKESSVWISMMEDLWEATKWFDHSKWAVDLYGDFTMIGDYYMDTRSFNKETLTEMLKLAVVSFYKHDNSDLFDSKILKKLIKWCIKNQGLLIDIDDIINYSKDKSKEIKLETRETYYKELKAAEDLRIKINIMLNPENLDKELTNQLLSELVIHLSNANLYREENYILPTTVVHVVKTEQAKEGGKGDCKPLLIKLAFCSLSPFVYFLSAIEQLGYMLFNLSESDSKCSLSAAKYFGRLVRALNRSLFDFNNLNDLIEPKIKFKKLMDLADELADIKKQRGNSGDINKDCPETPDLYELVLELFQNF
jgi:hypothetical protein